MPLTMQLAFGTLLDGYEILGLLGSGGMGEVYRARDPLLKRDVAIKVLPASVGLNPDRLRRFEQEAQATAALNHPNILAIHRFGIFEGLPYLVSELLEGQTLRQLVESKPLSARKAIDIGAQVAHGLAVAHEKGIVHRDLKPENLFVLKGGRVKILDFGLAKLMQTPTDSNGSAPTLTHATDPGIIMGTAGYMSPEQVRGHKVDHRTDIFAFGAILYEMLSGTRPFHRPTAVETMTAILNEDPPSISQLAQTTPPGLQRIVHRCLEKNPEQRFQSSFDLAFALEALTESGSSFQVPAIPAVRRFPRRGLAAAAGLLVFFVLVAAGWYLVMRKSDAPPLQVTQYAQITHIGSAGDAAGTDGSRIYLNRGISDPIQEVAISGGEVETLRTSLKNPYLNDVSPDGSTLLVQSFEAGMTAAPPLYTVRILGGAQRYLLNASTALWSQDGKSIFYINENHDLCQMRSDGSEPHMLAPLGAGGDISSFNIAPNGQTIRFARDKKFWEMSVNGSNLHELFPGWHATSQKCCGAWSANGEFFFFVAGPESQIWALDDRRSLIHRPSGQPFQVTSSPLRWGHVVPSKDGRSLFSLGSTRRGELVRHDPKSGQFEPFLDGVSASLVSFSRDGQAVAYVSYPEGDLWKANRDGSGRVQLIDSQLFPEWINLAPDGSQVVFMAATPQGREQAWIVSTQGGTPRRLLPGEQTQQTDPSWSPDGSKILFATNLQGGSDKDSSIRILDLATNQQTTLPETNDKFSPHWSPDGQSIEASSLDLLTLSIFDLKTQHWSTPYKGLFAYANWSSDSHYLYLLRYAGSSPAVLKVPAKGGTPQVVVDLKSFRLTGALGLWLGLDPTDAPLLLRDLGSDDVYALSLEHK